MLAAWLAERNKQCGLEDNPYLFTKERRRIVSVEAMAKRQSGDYLRQQIYKDMRETMLAAGIDSRRAHPHTIKHTTAAHAIRAGIDIAYVKELLGHKHISSTVQYLHISQEDAAAKQNTAMQNAF